MRTAQNPANTPRLAALRRLMAMGGRAGKISADDADGAGEAADSRHSSGQYPRHEAQTQRLARGVLRHVTLLDELLGRPGKYDRRKTPESSQWLLRLAAYETIFQDAAPAYAIGSEAVDLARAIGGERSAKFINAMVRQLLPALPKSAEALAGIAEKMPDAVRWSVPKPIIQALAEGYGKDAFRNILPKLAGEEAPVWLRVNTLKTDAEAAARELENEGVLVERTTVMEEALRWMGGTAPWKTAAWGRGEITVQDFAAMLAARLLDCRGGIKVLDACAAPGGKTGHLWESMRGEGRLVAEEIERGRRKTMAQALGRLYGMDHRIEVPDEKQIGTEGNFDRVLLDVPCLALGLIGRHPEIRWDGRLRHLKEMTAKQRALLESGAARTGAGGRLLWVTCSPTRSENEGVVNPWLERSPQWRIVEPAEQLGERGMKVVAVQDGFVRTRPDRIACDGFCMVLLEREAAS